MCIVVIAPKNYCDFAHGMQIKQGSNVLMVIKVQLPPLIDIIMGVTIGEWSQSHLRK